MNHTHAKGAKDLVRHWLPNVVCSASLLLLTMQLQPVSSASILASYHMYVSEPSTILSFASVPAV